MAINKVTGKMLHDNLERFGTDLIIDDDLLIFDVTNRRLGVNNATPAYDLSVTGIAGADELRTGNISITTAEISCSAVGGLSIDAGGAVIDVNASRIVNMADPINGKDSVNIDYLTGVIATIQDRIYEGDSSLIVNDSALSTFDFTLDGTSIALFEPTKSTFINDLAVSTIINDGSDIRINTGTFNVAIDSSSSLVIPSGTTPERPSSPEVGAIRFNEDNISPEVWDGIKWSNFSPDFVGIDNQIINPSVDLPLGLPAPPDTYQLNKETITEAIFVSINGVVQEPDIAYVVMNDDEITFADPLQATDIVSIRYFTELIDVRRITSANGTTHIEASSDLDGNFVLMTVSNIPILEVRNLFVEFSTNLVPDVDNTQSVGTPLLRFNNMHSTNVTTTNVTAVDVNAYEVTSTEVHTTSIFTTYITADDVITTDVHTNTVTAGAVNTSTVDAIAIVADTIDGAVINGGGFFGV